MATMQGVVLPGNSTVELRDFPVPEPGSGQVLITIKASSICGSDIRAIYRKHLGVGPEKYQGVIAGHEPAGQIVKVAPNCKRYKEGDRVVVYHIAGCGCCEDCKHGYMISCQSEEHRRGYGWQRDGGHAPYMLAEENNCVKLPDSLSYIDGAFCACGFGTAWEALTRMNVSGQDRLLITGLGPVGLAVAMLGRALGAGMVIGTDISDARIALAREKRLVDHAFNASMGEEAILAEIKKLTNGKKCEKSIDCSGAPSARLLALKGTRQWGKCAFVGEGNNVEFDVSQVLIHNQITLYGSWVTSLKHLEDLVERLDRWDLHPETTSTKDVFLPLSEAARAYDLADKGQTGKVCIVFD